MAPIRQPDASQKYSEHDFIESTEYECPRQNVNGDLISDEAEGVLSKKSALSCNSQKNPNAKNIMVSHALCLRFAYMLYTTYCLYKT